MNVSNIQAVEQEYGFYTPRNRVERPASAQTSRNTGPDTVSISPEARALLGEAATQDETDSECLQAGTGDEAAAATASSGATSLKEMGFSLFSMILESIFMADMAERDQTQAAVEEGLPDKQSTPFEDSGKVAELKKVMNDVASGKADISDIPKAMAAGAGAGRSARGSVATQKNEETPGSPLA